MSSNFVIRNFKDSDTEEMLSIFNSYIKTSFAAYPENDLTLDRLKKLIEPAKIILVIYNIDDMIGFGYIASFKPLPNFNHTGVLTYFLTDEYTGKGLGTKLFNELIERGKQQGITNYIAHISSKNDRSLNFHKKLGFAEVGRLKKVGIKFGEPFDIVWVQKNFSDDGVE